MSYLQDDEADDRACYLGKEGEGNGCFEVGLGVINIALVFVLEAWLWEEYIFSWYTPDEM